MTGAETSPLTARAVAAFGTDPAGSGFVLDFDGTLSPIAPTPAEARAAPGAAAVLEALAQRYGLVALLSGRRAAELHALLPVPGVRYLGLYGAEELGAGTGPPPAWVAPLAAEAAGMVSAASAGGLTGCIVEDKGHSLALHWREAADPQVAGLLITWAAAHAARLGLEVRPGRMVVELVEPGPTKESTVASLIGSGLRRLVIAGDDVADVASLARARTLLGAGALRLAVVSDESPPGLVGEADLVVAGPGEVIALLRCFLPAPGSPVRDA